MSIKNMIRLLLVVLTLVGGLTYMILDIGIMAVLVIIAQAIAAFLFGVVMTAISIFLIWLLSSMTLKESVDEFLNFF